MKIGPLDAGSVFRGIEPARCKAYLPSSFYRSEQACCAGRPEADGR